MGVGGKEEGRVTEDVELTKVKHIHSWDTLRNPFAHRLQNYNERQD
jgi:hypothetical protein